jgi:hypothetical protein
MDWLIVVIGMTAGAAMLTALSLKLRRG